MARLSGKVAIVTGSASGIGAATARTMAREGARVALGDLDLKGAEAVAAEIRAGGGDAFAFKVDISDDDGVKAMVAETVRRYGGVDVLHNNAAAFEPEVRVADSASDLVDLDMAVFDRTMAVNIRGYVLCCRYAVPEMLKRGGGSIINMSSALGLAAEPVRGAYSTSKGAVNMFTRHIAAAYGKRGIRCNAVAPGLVLTHPDRSAEFQDMMLRHHMTPRLGLPEDIANMVAFLASDEAAFVTGQVIQVDGGYLAHAPEYADLLAGVRSL